MSNPFFRNHGPILLLDVLKNLNIIDYVDKKNITINDIKDLYSSNNSDNTFFHSKKYLEIAKNTKSKVDAHIGKFFSTKIPNKPSNNEIIKIMSKVQP